MQILTPYERLCEVIPAGVNSPVRACRGLLDAPVIAERGEGDLIYDIEGNKYIDYCGSWGPLIHGHANPKILDKVQKRMVMGTTFGMTTMIEEALARRIIQHVPSIEKIRFVSSGTEATMSALRLARGFTGKKIVIKFTGNFHGHADPFLVKAGSGVATLPDSSSAGVPSEVVQYTWNLPYNNVQVLEEALNSSEVKENLAAIIFEPVCGNMGVVPATDAFMSAIREGTKRLNAVMIMDEVITGFRLGLGGAQALYKVKPDITCLGKIIGGGFPAAAFGGRLEIMDKIFPLGPVYQGGTLSGNPVAMEAGLETIRLCEAPGFYEDLKRKTDLIIEPVKDLIRKKGMNVSIQSVGSMLTLFFGAKKIGCFEDVQTLNPKLFADFFRAMLRLGIYLPPSLHEAWFVSSAHKDEHLIYTRDRILDYLTNL